MSRTARAKLHRRRVFVFDSEALSKAVQGDREMAALIKTAPRLDIPTDGTNQLLAGHSVRVSPVSAEVARPSPRSPAIAAGDTGLRPGAGLRR